MSSIEREPTPGPRRRTGMARTAPRLLAALVVAGLAVAPLAACGSDDDPEAGQDDPTTTTTAAEPVGDEADEAPGDPDAPVSSPDGDDGASSPGSPGDDAATTVAPDPGADPGGELPPAIPAGDAETLVGLTEAEAEAAAEADGWTLRVVRRDGEDLAYTEDYSPTRVNVAIDEGAVVQIMFIG